MSTHSFVGRIEPDETFSAHTVTYDGYPEGVGASLARLLVSEWAAHRASRVLAEMAPFRHWWSIGPGLDGPTRVGYPNERPEEQDLPLVTGKLGQAFRGDQQWGYLFRGNDELVVVKIGEWWKTPPRPAQQWAVVRLTTIGRVDWAKLRQQGVCALRW